MPDFRRGGRSALGLAFVCIGLGCALLAQATGVAGAATPGVRLVPAMVVPPGYKLGVGDVISVQSLRAPELDRSLAVGAEGEVQLPYLQGPLLAAGLTPTALAAKVNAALARQQLVVAPDTDVMVVTVNSHAITVGGAVMRPLVLHAVKPVPLLEAIVDAGGPNPDAAGADVVVTVPADAGSAKATTYQIPYSVLASGAPSSNLLLRGGETVAVRPSGEVFVTGAVKKPGAFPIKMGQTLTVAKAMALTEGWTSSAHLSQGAIWRQGPGGVRAIIPVDIGRVMDRRAPDPVLQANDVLYVPEDGKRKLMYAVASGATSSVFYALALMVANHH